MATIIKKVAPGQFEEIELTDEEDAIVGLMLFINMLDTPLGMMTLMQAQGKLGAMAGAFIETVRGEKAGDATLRLLKRIRFPYLCPDSNIVALDEDDINRGMELQERGMRADAALMEEYAMSAKMNVPDTLEGFGFA